MGLICSKTTCGKKLTRHEQLCGNTCTVCQEGPEVVGYIPRSHTGSVLTAEKVSKLLVSSDELKVYMKTYENLAPVLRAAIYNRIEKSLNNLLL